MSNLNKNTVYSAETISESKKIVEIVGISLGNFIADIYKGEISSKKWNDTQKELVQGTRHFILGGSIGTNGFTKELIPLWIKKRLAQREIKEEDITILPVADNMNSFKAGALGAFYSFLPEAVPIIANEVSNTPETKIPIIPLMDIGGTKIHFILAHINKNADLPSQILEAHTFPTPFFESPTQFYNNIASYIYPVLKRFENSDYELIKTMGIGQPGLFESSQGKIKAGAADLGNLFGQCPNDLITEAFKNYGINYFSFHFCNDGNAQFFGLVSNIKKQDALLWEKLKRDKKVMYLGIGTGLGIGYGTIEEKKLTVNKNIKDAIAVFLPDEFREYLHNEYEIIRNIYGKDDPIEYRQIASSKLFHNYMHALDLKALREKKSFCFLKHTGVDTENKACVSAFLESEVSRYTNGNSMNKKSPSPLNAALVNEILKDEINTTKTEVIFNIRENELKQTLNGAVQDFSSEIINKLKPNMKGSSYEEIVSEVITAKQRGNTVYFAGIGKSHSIGKNLSYIYNNLGIRSAYIELTGANSENLTTLKRDDLVFLISNSGKAYELLNILPYIRRKGCKTVAVTGERDSYLRKGCDFFLNTYSENNPSIVKEAPTTSTTLALVAGTAIAITVSFHFDYSENDFYLDHPALEFDENVKFKEVKSDPSFNIATRIRDIFDQFSGFIAAYKNNEQFKSQILNLAKQVLVSHYNNRTVFLTGSGASLKVAEKVAATLTSIGIDADIVNPAQLPHGDFAHIKKNDLLVVFSYSGNTRHLNKICDIARDNKGAKVALVTSKGLTTKPHNVDLIININEIDESRLVPIPDQKIVSSCINLVVGDILAVILANILKTSKEVFAKEAHQGGEIGREEDMHNEVLTASQHGDLTDFIYPFFDKDAVCTFQEKFDKANCDICGYEKHKDCYLHKEAMKLLEKHLKTIDKECDYQELLKIFKNELATFNGGFNMPAKTGEVLIIGAGSIGLTYIARILCKNRKTLHFVDENDERIRNLRLSKKYTLNGEKHITIKNFSVIHANDIPRIATLALRNNLVFISVGINNHPKIINTIKFIVLRRYAYNIQEPINFVFNENFEVTEHPLAKLRHDILDRIDSQDVKIYFTEKVGLVPAVDEVLAPTIPDGFNFKDRLPVESEIAPMYISKAEWKTRNKNNGEKETQKEENELSGCEDIHLVTDFQAYHMRKLWIHNMAHFLIGIRAEKKGIKTIWEAATDDEIKKNVEKSIEVIGHEIYRRWAFEDKDLESYSKWLFSKYRNQELNDMVDRILREPRRKLGKHDRLLGPLNYAYKYGKSDMSLYQEIIKGICRAMELAVEHEHIPYQTIRNEVKENLLIDFEEVAVYEKKLRTQPIPSSLT